MENKKYSVPEDIDIRLKENPDCKVVVEGVIHHVVVEEDREGIVFPWAVYVRKEEKGSELGVQISRGRNLIDAIRGIGLSFQQEIYRLSKAEEAPFKISPGL